VRSKLHLQLVVVVVLLFNIVCYYYLYYISSYTLSISNSLGGGGSNGSIEETFSGWLCYSQLLAATTAFMGVETYCQVQ
jgi:hypothetical protein